VKDEILSRNLLRPEETDKGGRKIQSYDFINPNRLSRPLLHALQSLHREAAREISQQLSRRGINSAQLELREIAQQRPDALVAELPSPAIVEILSLSSLPGTAILQLDLDLGLALINLLLGGRRSHPEPTPRPLTEAEHAVLADLVSTMLDCLSRAWRKACVFEFSVIDSARALEIVHFDQPQEPLVAVRFQLTAAEAEGGIVFALPMVVLERSRLGDSQHMVLSKSTGPGGGKMELDRAAGALGEVPITCRAEVGAVSLTLSQLGELGEGDVLLVRPAGGNTVALVSSDQCRFRGRLITQGRHLAVEIHDLESTGGG